MHTVVFFNREGGTGERVKNLENVITQTRKRTTELDWNIQEKEVEQEQEQDQEQEG